MLPTSMSIESKFEELYQKIENISVDKWEYTFGREEEEPGADRSLWCDYKRYTAGEVTIEERSYYSGEKKMVVQIQKFQLQNLPPIFNHSPERVEVLYMNIIEKYMANQEETKTKNREQQRKDLESNLDSAIEYVSRIK